MDEFELMQQMDYLSELKERVDDRYKPIVEAKINYRLQKAYEERIGQPVIKKKQFIPERFER